MHFAYTQIDAATNRALVEAVHIKNAPTLVVPNGQNGYTLYDNASKIRGYVDSIKDAA